MQTMDVTDAYGNTGTVTVEAGVPPEYAARGATTVAQYQIMAQQDLSDKTLKAQQESAQQQQAFNERQAAEQKAQYDQQQQQVQEQAQRQSAYDTGRSQTLGEATNQINQAFSRFSPDYFNQYQQQYQTQAQSNIDRQRQLAEKELRFGLARAGLSGSQTGANQFGLISETAGRAAADQSVQAQQARSDLENRVAQSRQDLMNQVVTAQSIAPPIAGNTIENVNQALQTQRSAISPIATSAGDVAAAQQAVPVVNTLSNIFAGLVQSGANFLGGVQQGSNASYLAGLQAKPPSGTTSTTTRNV